MFHTKLCITGAREHDIIEAPWHKGHALDILIWALGSNHSGVTSFFFAIQANSVLTLQAICHM